MEVAAARDTGDRPVVELLQDGELPAECLDQVASRGSPRVDFEMTVNLPVVAHRRTSQAIVPDRPYSLPGQSRSGATGLDPPPGAYQRSRLGTLFGQRRAKRRSPSIVIAT